MVTKKIKFMKKMVTKKLVTITKQFMKKNTIYKKIYIWLKWNVNTKKKQQYKKNNKSNLY